MIFSRKEGLSGPVRERAGLSRSERVLAWTGDEPNGWLIATKTALVIVRGGQVVRLGWDEIEHASWDRDSETLSVTEVGSFGDARAVHIVPVRTPGDLLPVLRERVTSTLVLQEPGQTPDGRTFILVVRRSPADRSLRAFVDYSAAADPDDPEVAEAVERALRRASWEIGAEL